MYIFQLPSLDGHLHPAFTNTSLCQDTEWINTQVPWEGSQTLLSSSEPFLSVRRCVPGISQAVQHSYWRGTQSKQDLGLR